MDPLHLIILPINNRTTRYNLKNNVHIAIATPMAIDVIFAMGRGIMLISVPEKEIRDSRRNSTQVRDTQPQYNAPYYPPVQHSPPPVHQTEPVPEFRTILAPVGDIGSEETYEESQGRLMIEYEHGQENECQMVPLAAPAVTQGGGIRKTQRANKTRPRIDRERLKALLESETDNSGELMDTIEEMFLPDQQSPLVQQKTLAPIDGNRQVPLTRKTKTGNIQEFVVPNIPKSGDPIRGLAGQPPYNVIDEILNKLVNITAGQLFNISDTVVKQMAISLQRCTPQYRVRKIRKLPKNEDDAIDDALLSPTRQLKLLPHLPSLLPEPMMMMEKVNP